MNTKIAVSLMTITIAAAIAVSGTVAYFSDVETAVGNTFTAGTLDLTLNETGGATADFSNIKPVDKGSYVWNVTNAGSDTGYLDVESIDVDDTENGCGSDAEAVVDTTCADTDDAGELSSKIDVDVYVDVDGDGTNSTGDVSIYKGALSGFISSDLNYEMAKTVSKNVRMDWSVDDEVGNEIQSDGATLGLTFELGQTAGQ